MIVKVKTMPKLSSLDQPAGHILCGFALVIIGAVFYKLSIPKSEDLIVGGLTYIGLAAKGLNGRGVMLPPSNSDTKTTTEVTSTSVSVPPKTA